MKSGKRGHGTSAVEVANVSSHGFWIFLDRRELFVPFAQFPWFKDASIAELSDVTRPGEGHLHWPRLDVDLAIDSIEHPDRYPLLSRAENVQPARVREPGAHDAPEPRRRQRRSE
jgi:hypothetical protein